MWTTLRWFHGASRVVMAATPELADELRMRGLENVVLWPRGVDITLFHPRDVDLCVPKPVFSASAALRSRKAFLSLELPGTKVIVGDGPARRELEQAFFGRGVSRRS